MADTEADREVQRHLDQARRSLRRAMDVCVRVARGRQARHTAEGRRARSMQRQIGDALRSLEGGPRRMGAVDYDPDLVPEDEKYPGWHRREN